jgi:hypothetical protein
MRPVPGNRAIARPPFVSAILLLVSCLSNAFGTTVAPPYDPTDDFSPGLGLFALVAVMVVLILVGVGVAIAGLILASMAVIVSLGIVSSSALLAIYRRRFASGLRVFHYQVSAVATAPAGIGTLALGSYLLNLSLNNREILVVGSVAGICGGLLLAFALDRMVTWGFRRLLGRI